MTDLFYFVNMKMLAVLRFGRSDNFSTRQNSSKLEKSQGHSINHLKDSIIFREIQ